MTAKVGENILNFAGDGSADGFGAAIDNVRLVRRGKCGKEDVIVNGDFSDGYNPKMGRLVFYEGIPGWRGDDIEIGLGTSYNTDWPEEDPVCHLDADSVNADIWQAIAFDKDFQNVSDNQI